MIGLILLVISFGGLIQPEKDLVLEALPDAEGRLPATLPIPERPTGR